jgi:hypothetical protein
LSPKHHGVLEAFKSMLLLYYAKSDSAHEQIRHDAKPYSVHKHFHVAKVKTVAS